jgi:PAS domain S-box-containing protein
VATSSDLRGENTSEALPPSEPGAQDGARPADDAPPPADEVDGRIPRAPLRGATGGVAVSLDAEGRVASWSSDAERLTGYRADEVLGRHVAIFSTPEDRAAGLPDAELREARERGLAEGEAWLPRKDGAALRIVGQVAALRDARGALLGFAKIWRDRARSEHAEDVVGGPRLLADASARLGASLDYQETLQEVARLVVPRAGDYCLIDVYGEDGRLHRVGAAHADPDKQPLLGPARAFPPSPREAGDPCTAVLEAARPVLVEAVTPEWMDEAALAPEHRREIEALGPRSVIFVPLVARTRVLGVMAIATTAPWRRYTGRDVRFAEDLAARCAAAIDNARLFKQASDAIRLRDEVLATVSHDLKSPLTAISANAQLLRRHVQAAGPAADERLVGGLDRIVQTAARMTGLIDELLDAARLELGEDVPLRPGPVDLVELAEQAAADARRTSDRHAIVVERRAERLVGLWDAARLRRVLDNLLGNAIKYSPEGGPVRVTLERAEGAGGPWAVARVEDRGVGIPPEDLPHVFERGRRGGNVGRIGGMGLGLAGACRIARQHGGGIDAESVVGEGSAFTLRLPLAVAARRAP